VSNGRPAGRRCFVFVLATGVDHATRLEGAYLAAAVLAGLLGNALLGWWWLDPVAALVMAAVAVRGGRESWRFRQSGAWWVVVEPVGETIHATGVAQVRQASTSPAVGTKAYPSENPTVADAPATSITTSRPPDTPLLRYSIADSLKAHKPFVVVFATPAFCQSRTWVFVIDPKGVIRAKFEGPVSLAELAASVRNTLG
jgi:hypothetical protein